MLSASDGIVHLMLQTCVNISFLLLKRENSVHLSVCDPSLHGAFQLIGKTDQSMRLQRGSLQTQRRFECKLARFHLILSLVPHLPYL